MNVTFLIGNGFDLNVGLDTRFRDVLQSYLKEESKDPRIVGFKKDIDQNIENWSDFEKQMGVYTEKFDQHNVDDYCFCMKNFKEHLINHLRNEEKRINYDASENKILSIFSKSIREFYHGLEQGPQNTLKNTPTNQARFNFISFNYTNIFDECIKILKQHLQKPANANQRMMLGSVLHIHGSTEKNVIMGVDNETQIENKEISNDRKIVRTIIKPAINKNLKILNDDNAFALINISSIICLFGLSLGDTDKTWWRQIASWLKTPNRILIIYNVVNQWNPIHCDEMIENVDDAMDKFFLAAEISDREREQIESRVHIGFNTDIFKINLTKPIKQNSTKTLTVTSHM